MKESLRMHPPVPYFSRQIEKPITVAGKRFTKSVPVSVVGYGIHHNPLVWSNPGWLLIVGGGDNLITV